jgi:hypothetical protein
MDRQTRTEEIARIRKDVLQRDPGGEIVEAESLFETAIKEAKAKGITIIHGSFGAHDAIDPVSCVARLSPLYDGALGSESFLACELLGWNYDQIWAFVSGYDLEHERLIDPRAFRHPDVVQLGERIRARHCPELSKET